MKIFRIFTIAAAALMMAACSTDDIAQLINGDKKNFTATIAAPNSGATTRTEYTEVTTGEAAGTINVAWKVGDEIALIHNGVKDVATVKTVNADGSATITGFITSDTQDGTDVKLVYPAEFLTIIDDEPYFDKMRKQQDGTLKYIQDNLDYRDGSGHLSVKESGVTLSEPVTMKSGIAIWKLTLMNGSVTPAAALEATKVTITKGNETLASTATLAQGKSEWTLAIPLLITDPSLTIEATVGEDTYTYTKAEGVTFTANTYYQNEVTLTKQAAGNIVDLSSLTADYEAQNGDVLTGTLAGNYKVSIADGATVTLDGVTINGVSNESYSWAGITCLGDATIILKDGSENTVKGFDAFYPGIHPAVGKTLTIKGTGKLTASSNGYGAGIGGGMFIDCGNIEIQGGVITAYGGDDAAGIGSANNSNCGSITISGGTVKATSVEDGAGIGSGYYGTCGDINITGGTVSATGGESGAAIGSGSYGSCGDILISGGTVSATGGAYAAAIGSGDEGSCGSIEITTDVTQVTATKVSGFETVGRGGNGSCTSVSIGGTVYWNGSAYQNGGGTYLLKSTILYPVPDPIALSAVTSSQLGWIVGNDGKAYAVGALPESVGAVAMICYVGSSTGVEGYTHGLALALTDVSANTLSWDNTGANNAGKTAAEWCSDWNTTKTITVGTWMLPSYDQWDKMITAAGGYEALRDGFSGIAGASNLQSGGYWSSTENGSNRAYYYDFGRASRVAGTKSSNFISVRACLAF